MKVIKIIRYKAGYEVRTEHNGGKNGYDIRSAYTPEGHYIGSPKDAHYLVTKKGIRPEKAKKSHNICSIGFCSQEWKWYGWSHRAIYGFAIGHVTKKGNVTVGHRSIPIGFVAKNLEDCKKLAKAFASEVS